MLIDKSEPPVQRIAPVPLNIVGRSFDKAAGQYVKAARLQQAVALDAVSLLTKISSTSAPASGTLLDLGCGPGWVHPKLQQHCHELVAADLSAAMLAQARLQGAARLYLQADAAQLPLPQAMFDGVFSSLMLQWCVQPQQVFAEVARVLKPGGQFVITTLVDNSLLEFQQSWQQAGVASPQLSFQASASLLQQASAAGLQVQAQQRSYLLFFNDVYQLAREFKQIGANAVTSGVSGLGGKNRWARFASAYEQKRTPQGLPLTYQVLFLFGQKP